MSICIGSLDWLKNWLLTGKPSFASMYWNKALSHLKTDRVFGRPFSLKLTSARGPVHTCNPTQSLTGMHEGPNSSLWVSPSAELGHGATQYVESHPVRVYRSLSPTALQQLTATTFWTILEVLSCWHLKKKQLNMNPKPWSFQCGQKSDCWNRGGWELWLGGAKLTLGRHHSKLGFQSLVFFFKKEMGGIPLVGSPGAVSRQNTKLRLLSIYSSTLYYNFKIMAVISIIMTI